MVHFTLDTTPPTLRLTPRLDYVGKIVHCETFQDHASWADESAQGTITADTTNYLCADTSIQRATKYTWENLGDDSVNGLPEKTLPVAEDWSAVAPGQAVPFHAVAQVYLYDTGGAGALTELRTVSLQIIDANMNRV